MKKRFLVLLMTVATFFVAHQALAAVWYVDNGVSSSGDGTSWGTAVKTIQEGIVAASATDDIWVKMGTYTLSVQIDVNKSVLLFGGFDGAETAREERDWTANVTTIDGNLATRCLSVTIDGVTIDGFTVTRGRSTVVGAGLENNAASTAITTIKNCIFDDNDTTLQGGAIDSRTGHMIILNCTFKNNDATTTQPRGGAIFLYAGTMALEDCSFEYNTAGSGGALNLRGPSGSVSITNCVFKGNSAYRSALTSDGGAILSDRTATITGCTFLDNHAIRYGGVIASYCPTGNTITFINCLFASNSAGPNEGGNTPGGGVIAINDSSTAPRGTLNIANCSFSGNSANGTGSTGGAIYNRIAYVWTQFDITNSILWGDSPDEIFIPTGGLAPTVSYSDVQGGYAGTGNIDADPLFVGGGYHLGVGSPCVNAGTDAGVYDDLDGDLRPLLGGFDMGSDEYSGACWDLDSDTYADAQCGGDDCDDANPAVHPGAVEGPFGDSTCADSLDNDCNGLADALDLKCQFCTDPEQCDDEVDCTEDSCDEGMQSCDKTPDDSLCDDANTCTDDTCDGLTGCQHSCNAEDYKDACCEDPACASEPICKIPVWGPSSVAGTHAPQSDALNYLIVLFAPCVAVVLWKGIRRRR